uniref:GOLD domain-containing protein n=1 Tax=Chenopodium quinoa TaxID=63459 RepID=A0A803N8S4_CHEQI
MSGVSLQCGDCGALLKSVAEAQQHAELTSLSNFSVSNEPFLNLIYSSCGKPCRSKTLKGPEGDQILDTHDKISEKFNFTAHKQGPFSFCFTNKSPYHETIDFDLQVGHFTYYDQHAKDEHVKPLVEQIEKLGQCLYNIQFEQHWLEAQTDRQALVNKAMSKRAIHKAVTESFALVGASVLQIYLLWRLFERKLGTSRV